MSSSDHVQLEKSLSDEMGGASPFTDRQFLYVNDQNNGNYSGTITIDSTTLSNSGSYIGWSESYLLIPTVLQLYSAAAGVTATSNLDFAMALKNGYYQLIHSLSVDFNNGSVVQQTPFLNVFSSFKCLTSWSDADIKNWGKICGFFPDTHDSWLFNNTVNSATNGLGGSGLGLCNNRLFKTIPPSGNLTDVAYPALVFTATPTVINTEATIASDCVLACANEGLLARMKWLNFGLTQEDPALAAGSFTANKALLLANSSATNLSNLFKAYVQQTANNRVIVFPAIVRMKDVCDFFDKMPLMKGATFRLQINTNQSLVQLKQVRGAVAAAGTMVAFPSLQLAAPPTMLGGGGTCPIMVSSNDLGQGLQSIVPVAAAAPAGGDQVDVYVACSIVRTQFTVTGMTAVSAPLNSVRLYAPAYTMSPQAEAAYLSQQPTKKIVYEDIFQYQFNTIGQSGWNYLVTNGLPNLRSLLVCPFLAAEDNGVIAGAATPYSGGVRSSSLLSPFSSSGGSPDPVALYNFQVQISGKNLFNDAKQYDYQEFVEQIVSSNQLNGGLTTGMASGQIGMDEFDTLYRFYYADCSRALPSEAGVPRSIQISGTNVGGKSVNLMVFASFERSITVDVRSGARID